MKAIEDMVVGVVTASLPVYAKEASLEEAKKIIGLRAVFGEVRKRRRRLNGCCCSCYCEGVTVRV